VGLLLWLRLPGARSAPYEPLPSPREIGKKRGVDRYKRSGANARDSVFQLQRPSRSEMLLVLRGIASGAAPLLPT
jgi:hypothetical protein